MEDFDFRIIFWIIIGLVYLFTRGRKKKAQEAQPPRRQQPAQTVDYEEAPPKKQLTFEELLREIEGMKQPAPPPPPPNPYRPPVKTEPEYVDYDDELKDEEVAERKYDYRKEDNIYEVYEDAKKQAFHRPSLEETVKLQDTIVRFDQFKEYEQKDRRSFASEYLEELKHPSGFRKAFIMSEILKRRF